MFQISAKFIDHYIKYKAVLEPRVSPDFTITWFMIPRWPLTPHLLRSHVRLYPRIIVSNSHKNTSKHVDTVTLFSKTLTKGQWPLDDLWPHFYWGHMCDSTQGSLCPSPMGIHQCMWIQWSILQNWPHTYTPLHIHIKSVSVSCEGEVAVKIPTVDT